MSIPMSMGGDATVQFDVLHAAGRRMVSDLGAGRIESIVAIGLFKCGCVFLVVWSKEFEGGWEHRGR